MRLLNKDNYQHFIFQLIRFGITGLMATLMHFLVVVAFVELEHLPPLTAMNQLHWHYIPALIFVLGFMALITYSFGRWWAFR